MSPGRIDASVVRRHLAALRSALVNLRRHCGRPVEALSGDLDESWTVLHGLLLCAQNALDTATHVVASLGEDPTDYRTAIERLGALGILAQPFAEAFADVAGFRNLLVHGYLQVDLVRVHELLNTRLDDFEAFADAIDAWLEAREGEALA